MTTPTTDTGLRCRESWSFALRDFDMKHDEGVYRLNIEVSYVYVADIAECEYPDWRPIAEDIKSFLSTYPTPEHYWEIVNKRLSQTLMSKYRVLSSLTIAITVPPLESNALQRVTCVTLERTGEPHVATHGATATSRATALNSGSELPVAA